METTQDQKEPLFDVVAVNMETNKVRLLDAKKTRENAEAIVKLAVMRRGVDEEFFAEVPTDTFKAGDEWRVVELPPRPVKRESSIEKIGNIYYPVGPRGLDR